MKTSTYLRTGRSCRYGGICTRWLLITSICLMLSAFAKSQDSLINLLKTELPDTTRIDILSDISMAFLGANLDSTLSYGNRAVELARQVDDAERLGYMLKNVGIAHYYKGDFLKTLDFWQESLGMFQRINHAKGEANLLSNIGSVYNFTGNYEEAMDYHLRCLKIAEEHNFEMRIGTALQNIGAIYSNMEDYSKAKDYYEKALKKFRDQEYEKGISIVVMNLSEVYRKMEDYKTAAIHNDEAKELFEKLNDPSLIEAYVAGSDLLLRQGKYTGALREAETALSMANATGQLAFQQGSNIALGKAFAKMGNNVKAKAAFKEAIELGSSIGVNIDLQQAYLGLVQVEKASGNFTLASLAQDSLLSINMVLYNIEKDGNISDLQLEFNLAKRETELALVNADNQLKSQEIESAKLRNQFVSALAGIFALLVGGMFYLYKYSQKKNKIISEERNKSDELLMNILPPETALELKEKGRVEPKKYEFATVLFTDFVEFTKKAESHSPEVIVNSIDYYFKKFDAIVLNHQLEKIKTIGDAYMCAGGLNSRNDDYSLVAQRTMQAASEIIKVVEQTSTNPPAGIVPFLIRIGIHSGPVVAGVVGQSKFQYDIWGDTVNVAARMESNSEAGRINVSENIFQAVANQTALSYRGTLEVKNKGLMKMYFYSDN